MGKVCVVTSGKGGVGKTTVVSNMGAGLALLGKRVVVLDADLGLHKLDLTMGLQDRVSFNFLDIADGVCQLKTALVEDKRYPGLFLLFASTGVGPIDISVEKLKEVVGELKNQFDYVFVDSPAGVESAFHHAVEVSEEAIVVTTPDRIAVRDAVQVAKIMRKDGIPIPQLIVNRVRRDLVRKEDALHPESISEETGMELLAWIPEDERVIIQNNKGRLVIKEPYSQAGMAYRILVRKMVGIESKEKLKKLKAPK